MNKTDSRHFTEIWKSVICVIASTVEEECSDEFKVECKLVNKTKESAEEYKHKLDKTYHNLREDLKLWCYGDNGSHRSLDYKKIAAILCHSILTNKPFSFDVSKACEMARKNGEICKENNWYVDNFLINYKMALYVSLAYIQMMLVQELTSCPETENAGRTLEKQGHLFRYPRKRLDADMCGQYTDAETFETNMIIELSRLDSEEFYNNTLLIAYLLYGVDMYNRFALGVSNPV